MSDQKDQYPEMTTRPLVQNEMVQQPYKEQVKVPPRSPPPPPPPYYSPGNQGPPNNYQQPPPMPNPYNNYGGQTTQVVVVRGGAPLPTSVICPYCRTETSTFVRHVAGQVTWLWCIFMAFFTGFCCIPFCIDSCQDVEMICMVCQRVKARQVANCC